MEATMCHEEHENNHNSSFNEAFRTILISLITAGVIWLVYTTVDNKSKIEVINYKLDHIIKSIDELNKKDKS